MLPIPWFDKLADILASVEEMEVWPEGSWMLLLP